MYVFAKFSLESSRRLSMRLSKINRIEQRLAFFNNLKQASNEQRREREQQNVDLSLFSELRGQISYRCWCSRALLSPSYYLPSSLIPFPRPLPSRRSPEYVHTYKILFIYPTELAVMQETITIYHILPSMINMKTRGGAGGKNVSKRRARDVISLMDVHMAVGVHFYYTWYFLCKSSLMIFPCLLLLLVSNEAQNVVNNIWALGKLSAQPRRSHRSLSSRVHSKSHKWRKILSEYNINWPRTSWANVLSVPVYTKHLRVHVQSRWVLVYPHLLYNSRQK